MKCTKKTVFKCLNYYKRKVYILYVIICMCDISVYVLREGGGGRELSFMLRGFSFFFFYDILLASLSNERRVGYFFILNVASKNYAGSFNF